MPCGPTSTTRSPWRWRSTRRREQRSTRGTTPPGRSTVVASPRSGRPSTALSHRLTRPGGSLRPCSPRRPSTKRQRDGRWRSSAAGRCRSRCSHARGRSTTCSSVAKKPSRHLPRRSRPRASAGVGLMSVVLVHGNPETAAIWDPSARRARARRRRRPVAAGLRRAGARGLRRDLRRLPRLARRRARGDGRADRPRRPRLGRWPRPARRRHATRPDPVVGDRHRRRADPDYVWHDMAQVWQTPGDGEAAVEMMSALPVDRARRRLRRRRDDRGGGTLVRRGSRSGDGPVHPRPLPLGGAAGDDRVGPGAGGRRAPAGTRDHRHRGPRTPAARSWPGGQRSGSAPRSPCSTGSATGGCSRTPPPAPLPSTRS